MNSFIKLDKTESTNDDAMAFIKAGKAFDGLSIFARTQTEGKGRRGNIWISEPEKNIALSVITSMEEHPLSHLQILSMITGLTVLKLIENHSNLHPHVKWPNDIFVGNKKLAGILIENVLSGQNWKWAVTGFGVNINQTNFSTNLHMTSLSKETGTTFGIDELAKELKEIFLTNLKDWKHHDWLSQYNNRLYRRNEEVRMKCGEEIFETIILGVDIKGNLITEDKTVRKWALNEIKMIIEA